jgi:hypothetical protein
MWVISFTSIYRPLQACIACAGIYSLRRRVWPARAYIACAGVYSLRGHTYTLWLVQAYAHFMASIGAYCIRVYD